MQAKNTYPWVADLVKRVEAYKKAKGITTTQFAAEAGVNNSKLSRILSGDTKTPHPGTRKQIEAFLTRQQPPDRKELDDMQVEHLTDLIKDLRSEMRTEFRLLRDELRTHSHPIVGGARTANGE